MSRPAFVLVHGAFHGGWCWRPVRDRLEAAGFTTHAPSQTGLGDRAHLLRADITMETFVRDITELVEQEELEQVVLVGHSFGARTAIGVTDRLPERIAHLVLLDGGLPVSGVSRWETMPLEVREARLRAAQEHDGGISVPPPPASSFGVFDPVQASWLEARLTPQPLGVDRSALVLAHEPGNGRPVTYVRFLDPPFPSVGPSAEYARQRPDWTYLEMPGGHEGMLTRPNEVASLLVGIATGSEAAASAL